MVTRDDGDDNLPGLKMKSKARESEDDNVVTEVSNSDTMPD